MNKQLKEDYAAVVHDMADDTICRVHAKLADRIEQGEQSYKTHTVFKDALAILWREGERRGLRGMWNITTEDTQHHATNTNRNLASVS